MGFEKKDMIDALRLEIQVIEKGGYFPSVHDPRTTPRRFRDSVTCLNMGLGKKKYPCSSCFLIDFVPSEYKSSNDDPCHKIPLNAKGDTVDSLERESDQDKLQAAVLGWLKTTLARLEAEVAVGK